MVVKYEFSHNLSRSIQKRQNLCGRDRVFGLTLAVKRQNVIDSIATGYYRAGQSFRQNKKRIDKKVIGKTENDRQIGKK